MTYILKSSINNPVYAYNGCGLGKNAGKRYGLIQMEILNHLQQSVDTEYEATSSLWNTVKCKSAIKPFHSFIPSADFTAIKITIFRAKCRRDSVQTLFNLAYWIWTIQDEWRPFMSLWGSGAVSILPLLSTNKFYRNLSIKSRKNMKEVPC